MQILYSFMSNTEPTDEQLHLLMQEVAAEVKDRSDKAEVIFFKHLDVLVKEAREKQIESAVKDE